VTGELLLLAAPRRSRPLLRRRGDIARKQFVKHGNRNEPASAESGGRDLAPFDGGTERLPMDAEALSCLADGEGLALGVSGSRRGHIVSTARPLRQYLRRVVVRYPDQSLSTNIGRPESRYSGVIR